MTSNPAAIIYQSVRVAHTQYLPVYAPLDTLTAAKDGNDSFVPRGQAELLCMCVCEFLLEDLYRMSVKMQLAL